MIITRAPLRVPLGGGGTDLPSYYSRYGGALVSAAVNRYVYITVNRRFDESLRVSYSRTEIVDSAEALEHPIVREALRLTGLGPYLEIVSIADAPANTGLGSSSSFTVALLQALHAYKREYPPPAELAEEAFAIEVGRLGEPIGKQDQYIAAYGGVTSMEIACCGTVHAAPLPVPEEHLHQLEHHLAFFYTGIRRSAGHVLADQNQSVSRGDEEISGAMHEIKAIGREIAHALCDGDLERFGDLLHRHWEVKKRLSGAISSNQIDRWYEIARKNGARGGKLMGAGGGGFFMFYTPNGDKACLRKALVSEGLKEVHFGLEPEGSKVILNV